MCDSFVCDDCREHAMCVDCRNEVESTVIDEVDDDN